VNDRGIGIIGGGIDASVGAFEDGLGDVGTTTICGGVGA